MTKRQTKSDREAALAAYHERHDAVATKEKHGGRMFRGSLSEAVEVVKSRKAAKKLISLYLFAEDIEKAKAMAEKRGLGYQTFIASTLHQALAD